MPQQDQNLLRVLKAELAFFENGGYRTPRGVQWRPQFIFQDSPTCLNYGNSTGRLACSECALIHVVPKDRQEERFPCRHIPLDESGQTLDWLYRTGTEKQTHEILANWLRANIARLQREAELASEPDVACEELAPVAGNGF
ncbi:MAG TPA: hypothetical protein VEI26_01810 [Terriglobales bacterium]|nr:hypothetical protein [Terriglobales bacterium]